jgi:hypothetical protein
MAFWRWGLTYGKFEAAVFEKLQHGLAGRFGYDPISCDRVVLLSRGFPLWDNIFASCRFPAYANPRLDACQAHEHPEYL